MYHLLFESCYRVEMEIVVEPSSLGVAESKTAIVEL